MSFAQRSMVGIRFVMLKMTTLRKYIKDGKKILSNMPSLKLKDGEWYWDLTLIENYSKKNHSRNRLQIF